MLLVHIGGGTYHPLLCKKEIHTWYIFPTKTNTLCNQEKVSV
jgi:hypothetical protein